MYNKTPWAYLKLVYKYYPILGLSEWRIRDLLTFHIIIELLIYMS